jgi:signal transduction histidine kinase
MIGRAMPTTADSRPVWTAALALHAALTAVVGLAVTIVWASTGAGRYWPAWVWFGLGVPLAAHAVVFATVRRHPRRRVGLLVHAEATGFLALALLLIWALAGGGSPWVLWPVTVLATVLAAHALVVVIWERFVPGARERELTQRVDELTRTRRGALDVQAAELRRIERDLHDGAQSRLVALSIHLGRAEARLEDRPEVAELVRRARDEAGAAIAELRDLARGIAPPVLADRGLAAAAEALSRRQATPVAVDARIGRRPPPVVETAAYFVVAEALTNAAKHAPGAAARVTLALDGDELVVAISDDGPGGADAEGSGLVGLRHRVEALDGALHVTSAPGAGTTIRAELPCVS